MPNCPAGQMLIFCRLFYGRQISEAEFGCHAMQYVCALEEAYTGIFQNPWSSSSFCACPLF